VSERPAVIVFDVNETLLDLGALRPRFESTLGSEEPMGEWFARMLHGSLVANLTDRFRPFAQIGIEALLVVAQRRGVTLTRDQAAGVVQGMLELPAHPEVADALDDLARRGHRLVTLSNGSTAAVGAQLEFAGIADRFEATFSVDEVHRFKPAPEPYLHVASSLGLGIDRILLVASHDWDIIGARSVGAAGAFLARPGVVWGVPDEPPPLVAPDLSALVPMLG
jgi:2-haloacid dehalogenase